ncbi:MAG: reactive intermediate/imine deaminase [Thermomicrobiales bacterium]|nr:reactive intermediate/imine deaminase [Thermomicrobiales bacterium]
MPHVERMHIPELFPPPGYAHVAVATAPRLVLTAGAVPLDRDGSIVGVGDVRVQTRQTLDNLMVQLAAGGAGGEDVLKTTVYVASTDRADLVAVWEEGPSPRRRARCLVWRCSDIRSNWSRSRR